MLTLIDPIKPLVNAVQAIADTRAGAHDLRRLFLRPGHGRAVLCGVKLVTGQLIAS